MINAMRVGLERHLYLKPDIKIPVDLIKIYFLSMKIIPYHSNVEEIKIREDGKIMNYPEGFFDQWSKDLETIVGF